MLLSCVPYSGTFCDIKCGGKKKKKGNPYAGMGKEGNGLFLMGFYLHLKDLLIRANFGVKMIILVISG